VALITGANHGIGAATAVALAGCGASVLVSYLRTSDPDDYPEPYRFNRAHADPTRLRTPLPRSVAPNVKPLTSDLDVQLKLRRLTLKLVDIVRRQSVPEPWGEGEKIPWDDPNFSRRMLNEHLSQDHDLATRRFEVVDSHVEWIHDQVLKGNPTRILDLGCGPGLYTNRLARLGHRCVGIDFSPASIAYATDMAKEEGLECKYIHEDIRTADYGGGYGLVMLVFGEFNVFRPEEARKILEKAHRALVPNGLLLLEPHTLEAVVELGEKPPSWYSADKGLFSDEPHLCLKEGFWDAERNVAIERYYIVNALTAEVARHSASTQAYTDDQYRSVLIECGFSGVEFYPSMTGDSGGAGRELTVVLSRKKQTAC
jgi:SAM-dependent methyltransferase